MAVKLTAANLTWEAVPGSSKYTVNRNGKFVTSTKTALSVKTMAVVSGDRVDVIAGPSGKTQSIVVTTSEPAPAPAPPGSYDPAPPAAPSPYAVPPGARAVSTSAQLLVALADPQPQDIVLADGIYDNPTYFLNTQSRVYARNLGKAVLTAGLVLGGNYGARAPLARGLTLNATDPAKCFGNAALNIWGAAGRGSQVLDCFFDGGRQMPWGIFSLQNDGLELARCRGRDYQSVIWRLSDNDPSSTAVIATVTDLDGAGAWVSNDGKDGAVLWVGHKVAGGVKRVKLADGSTCALQTCNAARDTLFEDLDLDRSPVGIYLEHDSPYLQFVRYRIAGANIGGNSEWDYGTPGNAAGKFDKFLGGTITSAVAGFNFDQGTESPTVQNTRFVGQSKAAIVAYKNVGTLTTAGNDYAGMKTGAVPVSNAHV